MSFPTGPPGSNSSNKPTNRASLIPSSISRPSTVRSLNGPPMSVARHSMINSNSNIGLSMPQRGPFNSRSSIAPGSSRQSAFGTPGYQYNPSSARAPPSFSNNPFQQQQIYGSGGNNSTFNDSFNQPYISGTTGSSVPEMVAASMQRTNVRRSTLNPGNGSINGIRKNPRQSYLPNTRPRKSVAPIPSTPLSSARSTVDKKQQTQMQQHIEQFLQANDFEKETQITITPKLLKSPEQKNFVTMFKWLYHRIDPGYLFTKSIESELFFLLKTLNYPNLDSINKSQASAVGGFQWPSYLAMLYWLVQLIESLETQPYSLSKILDGQQAEESLDQLDSPIDYLHLSFQLRAYKRFLANRDYESDVIIEEMNERLQEYIKPELDKQEQIQNEIAQMQEELEKKSTEDDIENLETLSAHLTLDTNNYEEYLKSYEQKFQKRKATNERLAEKIQLTEEQLNQTRLENQELKDNLKANGKDLETIDNLNSQLAEYRAQKQELELEAEEISNTLTKRREEATEILKEIEARHRKYNELVQYIKHDVRGSSILKKKLEEDPTFFDITLDSPLADENLGKSMLELLKGKDFYNAIRPILIECRKEIGENIHATSEEVIKNQERFDRLSESLREKTEQLDTLENRLNMANATYKTKYDTYNNDQQAYKLEIETLEGQIAKLIRKQDPAYLAELEERAQKLKTYYETLQKTAKTKCTATQSHVDKYSSMALSFRLYVNESIFNHEGKVVSELEKYDNGAILDEYQVFEQQELKRKASSSSASKNQLEDSGNDENETNNNSNNDKS